MKVRREFKIQDCWLGIFWRREGHTVHFWICLLPCLPLHVQVDVKKQAKQD